MGISNDPHTCSIKIEKMKPTILILVFITISSIIAMKAVERENSKKISEEVLIGEKSNEAIAQLVTKVKENPDDRDNKIKLAFAYIRESRNPGKAGVCDAKAMKLIEEVLKKNENDFEALIGKGIVELSQHHFAEALVTGKKALTINRYHSSVYGILTDAYLESGQYDKAVETADMMAEIRPDLRSYSRISYLREILGDVEGAIYAMDMAVQSGVPGLEETEWARYQLGTLYEKYGDDKNALRAFEFCKGYKPDFTPAYIGLGRVYQRQGNYAFAEKFFRTALDFPHDYTVNENLGKLYRQMNLQTKAAEKLRLAIAELTGTSSSETFHGHYTDKELSALYLQIYDYTNALKHIQLEQKRRVDNIEVNHQLAWTYYSLGKYSEAKKFIDLALKTHSKDPELLFHAGLIHWMCGNKKLAKEEVALSIKQNPRVNPVLKHEWNRYESNM